MQIALLFFKYTSRVRICHTCEEFVRIIHACKELARNIHMCDKYVRIFQTCDRFVRLSNSSESATHVKNSHELFTNVTNTFEIFACLKLDICEEFVPIKERVLRTCMVSMVPVRMRPLMSFPHTKCNIVHAKISKSKRNPGIVSADNHTMRNHFVKIFFSNNIPSCF